MADWPELKDHLKESNRQQADDIFAKLRQIGCDVHEAGDKKISMLKFTKQEVDCMAEMEHARWNVERLLDGWRLGEEKDVGKKISPFLVSWDALPENVKKWDRQGVRAIPKLLADVGLEVRRKRKK